MSEDDPIVVGPEDLDDAVALAARRLRNMAGKKGRGGRYVRTPEGARFYGQPIGTLITADIIAAAERKNGKRGPKNALAYNPIQSGKKKTAPGSRPNATGNHLKDGPHPVDRSQAPKANKTQNAASKKAATPRVPDKPEAQQAPRIKDPVESRDSTPEFVQVGKNTFDVPAGSRLIRRNDGNVVYARTPDGGTRMYTDKGEVELNDEQHDALSAVFRSPDPEFSGKYSEESPLPERPAEEKKFGAEAAEGLDDVAADLDSAIQELPPEQRARFEEVRDRLGELDRTPGSAVDEMNMTRGQRARLDAVDPKGTTDEPDLTRGQKARLDAVGKKKEADTANAGDGNPPSEPPKAPASPDEPESSKKKDKAVAADRVQDRGFEMNDAPKKPKVEEKPRPQVGDKITPENIADAQPGDSIRIDDPIDGSIKRYTKRDDNKWYTRGDNTGYDDDEFEGADGSFIFVRETDSPASGNEGDGNGKQEGKPGDAEPAGSGGVADSEQGGVGGLDGRGDSDGQGVGDQLTFHDGSAVPFKSKINPSDRQKALREQGFVSPDVYELDSEKGASSFRNSMLKLKENNKYHASVNIYDEDEYKGMRLFTNDDGTAGFALKGDELVSVFVHSDSKDRGSARSLVASAVDSGATRLDAFDTVLPKIYAKEGFVPAARLKFNRDYKPEGWNEKDYSSFNGGEPDVVFMSYDADRIDSDYNSSEGEYVKDYDSGVARAQGKPAKKNRGRKRAEMPGIENDGPAKGNPILDLPEGDGEGDAPNVDFIPNKDERGQMELGEPEQGKRGRKKVPGFVNKDDGGPEGTDGPGGNVPDDGPEAPTGPANAPGGPEAPTSFEEQDFHPDADGDPNGIAVPEVTAEGHSWSLKEGNGVTKDWLDNAPAGSQFRITGGKGGKEWGTFQKDVDGHWRRIDGRLGHFNPRTSGLQGNFVEGHNFNMFNEDGELTGDYASGKVSTLGDASYRPLHISKSYEHILPRTKDLDAMPDGVSVIVYDPANSLRVNNVPRYTQYYKKDGKWHSVTAEGMEVDGLSSDDLGANSGYLFKSSKGDDTSVIPHSKGIDPGSISPRARYYARNVFDGEFSEGSVIWRIRTDKETNTTGQKTYAYRHVGTNEYGEDLWIGQEFGGEFPTPVTTDTLNRTIGGEFFVDDSPRTIEQFQDRMNRAGGVRNHYLEDDDLSPLVDHFDADIPDHMDYFNGDNIRQFSQLHKYDTGSVVRIVGAPGYPDSYMRKEDDGWHRMTGPDTVSPEVIKLDSNSEAYHAFKDKNRGVRFDSFGGSYDKDDRGIDLTPDGHTASVREVNEAFAALDNYEGPHFSAAVKKIPEGNILRDPKTMDEVLRRAKLAHPNVHSDKEAVSRYLRSLVNQRRKNFRDRDGEKFTLGKSDGPLKPAGIGRNKVAYADFAPEDIDEAIQILESSPNVNAASLLERQNNALAYLDTGIVLKNHYGAKAMSGLSRGEKKQKFIEFLKAERIRIDELGLGGVNKGKGEGNVDGPEMVDWGGGLVPVQEPLPPLEANDRRNLHWQVYGAQVGEFVEIQVPGFGKKRFEKVDDDFWGLRDASGNELGTWNDKQMSDILKREKDPVAEVGAYLQAPEDEDTPYAPFNFNDWNESGYEPLAKKVDQGYTVVKQISKGNNVNGAVYQVRFEDGSLGVKKTLGSTDPVEYAGLNPESFDGEDIESSREILTSALGQLLGISRMPGAHVREEDGQTVLFTDYKNGIDGFEAEYEGRSPDFLMRLETSGFRQMMWFDTITYNEDRHGENYKVQDADLASPIDHGLVRFRRRGRSDRLPWRHAVMMRSTRDVWKDDWDAIKADWRDKIVSATELFKQNGFDDTIIDDLLYNLDSLDRSSKGF